jgi:iron complex outermembrane receptor protein
MSKSFGLRTLLFAASTFAAIPVTAVNAQGAGESATLDEIIVTARRREESLQSVPISMTAMTGEQLQESGVTSVRDLQAHVPSLVVATQGTDRMVVGFGIRGMRSTSFLVLDDPAVGTYFAEGVQVRTYGFGETLFDIQSIQVLKGPQGTLFGRNNTGGAILVEPNKPSTLGFEAQATAGGGSHGLYYGNGAVNIPVTDTVALRVAGSIKKSDGYSTNILSGQKWDNDGSQAGRVSLLLWPSDSVKSTFILDYLHADQAPNSTRIKGFTPLVSSGFRALFTPAVDSQNSRDLSDFESYVGTNGPNDAFAPFRCAANSFLKCRSSTEPKIRLHNWGVLNNTQIKLTDNLTLKNIAS